MNNEVWIRDLSCYKLAEAISAEHKPGAWMAVDYEIAQGPGTMLFAVPEAQAPEKELL